jgi:hypothetical protein
MSELAPTPGSEEATILVGGMTREEFLGEPERTEFVQPKRTISKRSKKPPVATAFGSGLSTSTISSRSPGGRPGDRSPMRSAASTSMWTSALRRDGRSFLIRSSASSSRSQAFSLTILSVAKSREEMSPGARS